MPGVAVVVGFGYCYSGFEFCGAAGDVLAAGCDDYVAGVCDCYRCALVVLD